MRDCETISFLRIAIASTLLAAATVAHADDKATAQSAFTEAKALEKVGKFVEACPLYEISYRADPQLGALLNVANCHQLIGRTATAWAEFHEAYELAGRKGDARAVYAGERADALAPRLVKLRVDAVAVTGLVVRRDGIDITNLIGQELAVDPGKHDLEATAPGRVAWKDAVVVTGEGKVIRSQVPTLEPVAASAATPPVAATIVPTATVPVPPVATKPAPVEDLRARRRRHVWALGIGGAGLGAVAVGLGFGLHAHNEWSKSRSPMQCDADGVCSASGAAHVASARSSAQIANWAIGSGAALVIGATVVWLTAPSARETRTLAVVPIVDTTTAGAAVAGRF